MTKRHKRKNEKEIKVEIKIPQKKEKEVAKQSVSSERVDFSQLQDAFSTKAPVLERIATASEFSPTQTRTQAPRQSNEIRNSDPFKYDAGMTKREDEKKYLSDNVAVSPERTDIDTMRIRERHEVFNQEGMFRNSETFQSNSNFERYSTPERFDMGKSRIEDPHTKKDKKYEFKLP